MIFLLFYILILNVFITFVLLFSHYNKSHKGNINHTWRCGRDTRPVI